MNYAQLAEKYIGDADRAPGDHMSVAEMATVNALTAIAYGLLNLAEVTARLEP